MTEEKRGFARLTHEEHLRLSALGGKKAHANNNAHKFTSEEAARASRKRWSYGKQKTEENQKTEPSSEEHAKKTECDLAGIESDSQ